MKGAALSAEMGLEKAITDLLKRGWEKKCFGAFLMPVRVPAGDSFTYLLINDPALLEKASPLPPITPVQGARALSSLTRLGSISKNVVAVMRPCEIRASIELLKLEQATLENIFFVSIDCPGALPLKDYLKNPEQCDMTFKNALESWDSKEMRPICRICHRFSMIDQDETPTDLHIGMLGVKTGTVFVVPTSPRGKDVLEKLDIIPEENIGSWEAKIKEVKDKRNEERREAQQELKSRTKGLDKLLESFSKCLNCHICSRVCPICYCRQCYFDSNALKLSPDNYLMRAEQKGGLRFPPDTLLFHLGRMSHMVLSCVSCGACEDACPMSIPVAQIFSLVADNAQNFFNYLPGRSIKEPLPLVAYEEEEFEEIVEPYIETYKIKDKDKGNT